MTDRQRILGIDPGSRLTGFGVLDFHGVTPTYVASGTVKSTDGAFADRLRQIFESVGEVVRQQQPTSAAVVRTSAGALLHLSAVASATSASRNFFRLMRKGTGRV